MKRPKIHPMSLVLGALATAGTALLVGGGTPSRDQLNHVSAEHLAILNHMSIVYLPDGMGDTVETIRISDVNVQVVNGVGATATVFTVLDRVVLRPLPYPNAGRLVVFGSEFSHDPGSIGPLSVVQLTDLGRGKGHQFQYHKKLE